MRHCGDFLLNTKGVRFLLQTSHRQVITESAERFKLTGDTRLQLGKCVLRRDIVERRNIIAKLCEVLGHDNCLVACYAKALDNGVEHALISQPIGGVNTQKLTYSLGVLFCGVCIFAKSYGKEVQILDILVGLCNPRSNRSRRRLHSGYRHAELCIQIDITLACVIVRRSKAIRVLHQLSHMRGKTSKSRRHGVKLRSQRSKRICQGLHLTCKLRPVYAVESFCEFGNFAKLCDSGLQSCGLRDTTKRRNGGGHLRDTRKIYARERRSGRADVFQLTCDRRGDFQTTQSLELFQTTGQLVDFRGVRRIKGGIEIAYLCCHTR